MHARYYSFNLGRFLSVDPARGAVGSSQSWNRYTYARNNPLVLIDPDGELARVIGDEAWSLLQKELGDDADKVTRDKQGNLSYKASAEELANNPALAQVARAVDVQDKLFGITVATSVTSANGSTIDLNNLAGTGVGCTALNLTENPAPGDTTLQSTPPPAGYAGYVVIHPGRDAIAEEGSGASVTGLFHELSENLHRTLESQSYLQGHASAIVDEKDWRSKQGPVRALPPGDKIRTPQKNWDAWKKNNP